MTIFFQDDCMNLLPELGDIDLIITDPPYNTGWNYPGMSDRKKNYHEWCEEWAGLCMATLTKHGVLCIINYPENNNILYTRLIEKGYNFVDQLVWTYPTNNGYSPRKYTRSYRTILIFSKDKKYTFNPVRQPYKNPTDARVKKLIEKGSEGAVHYNVFTINLCKKDSRDKKNHGINQLPRELVEMLIHTFSTKGDIVLDPFVGNGTVMDIADEMGRDGMGIDINKYGGI